MRSSASAGWMGAEVTADQSASAVPGRSRIVNPTSTSTRTVNSAGGTGSGSALVAPTAAAAIAATSTSTGPGGCGGRRRPGSATHATGPTDRPSAAAYD